MRIYRFPPAILLAIEAYIIEFLPALVAGDKKVKYYDYELAPNELSSYVDNNVMGAVAVYVRDTKFPNGSQNGTWKADNEIEIDCYGFGKALTATVDNKNITIPATKSAELNCQSIITAAFLATTERETLANGWGVLDENDELIQIAEKEPLHIESFTQEDTEKTQIAECAKKFKLRLAIEETTIAQSPGDILSGFNACIEAYNNDDILQDGDTLMLAEGDYVHSFGSVVTG